MDVKDCRGSARTVAIPAADSSTLVYMSQSITGLINGTHNLSDWVCSGGGQTAMQMDVKEFGNGSTLTVDMRSVSSGTRTLFTITNVPLTKAQATISFSSNAAAGQ